MSSLSDSSIYVAGHRGMVGAAVVRALRTSGHERLITAGRDEVDLRDQAAVRDFFVREQPEVVVLAAARVGGIYANASLPADFLYDNLMIAANVIEAAWRQGVRRLLFLGSSDFSEKISAEKYTGYGDYQKRVGRFLPKRYP